MLKLILTLAPLFAVLVAIWRSSAGMGLMARLASLGLRPETGALVFDLIAPRDLLDFVRAEANELNRNVFTLSDVLPSREVDDLEFRFTRGNFNDQDVATYRTFDTEAPIAGRQGVARITGALPPLSRKIPLGEEERLRKRALETGNNRILVDAIYDDAANMVRAVQGRLELARGEALYTGKVILNENGVQATVDFGRAAGHTVAPAVLWSSTGTADPVLDLLGWIDTYVNTNGARPGSMLTSTTVLNYLLRNVKMRELSGSQAGTPGIISRDQVDAVFGAFGIPPIRLYDTTVRVGGAATRVIPSDRLILLPPATEPLGETFYGVTAEALDLQERGQIVAEEAPGIVATISRDDDPVRTWTKAAGIALPILGNPDLTLAADVA